MTRNEPSPACGPYPRPDFDRSRRWATLNGRWDFFPGDALDRGGPPIAAAASAETIRVPGPWETMASGGRHDWLETAWYRRGFHLPADWPSERIILKFGAVFHECEVWVNQTRLGSHEGGYLPFEFDITDCLVAGENTVAVRVVAPKDKRDIPHGKQRSLPCDDYDGCCFTPCSGIWQPVWLEPRATTFIRSVQLTPRIEAGGIDARVIISGPNAEQAAVTCEIQARKRELRAEREDAGAGECSFAAFLPVEDPTLWSPWHPQLYGVSAVCVSADGDDQVRAYTGLRRIEARDGAVLLNGKEIYLRGVLDQGYWPHSGLTPPDDAAFGRDIKIAAEAGFNLVRKHLKPEDPRWLYEADRAGMLVWAEPASLGRFSPAGKARFEREIASLIARDYNHPSVVIWGAYNEEWGLDWDIDGSSSHVEAARDAYQLIRAHDPSRLAIDNSGWLHVATDVLDWHYYNEDPAAFRSASRAIVEDRGFDFDVWHCPAYPVPKRLLAASAAQGTVDAPIVNSEYGGGWNSVSRAWHLRWQTQSLRLLGANRGYVYTELYDIEHETVGIYDADRRTKDMAGVDLRDIHAETVIAPLVSPICPGFDIIAAGGQTLTVRLRVSHEGAAGLDGHIDWQIGDRPAGRAPISVGPHSLSPVVEVDVPLPCGYGSTRVGIVLVSDAEVIARTFVDVAEAMPHSHLPPDTGWRALVGGPNTLGGDNEGH